MIQFGIQPIGEIYVVDDVRYRHLAVFVGVGAQYGVGECILPEIKALDFIQNVGFLERHFSRYVFNGPERFWHYLHHLIPQKPEWIRAIDMASWDLQAKLNGVTIEQLFHPGQVISTHEIISKISIVDVADPIFNSSDFLPFESTQGVSDIKIHTHKYPRVNEIILSQHNSFMTGFILSALLPESVKIICSKVHLQAISAYSNCSIVDDKIIIEDRLPAGHGLKLNR